MAFYKPPLYILPSFGTITPEKQSMSPPQQRNDFYHAKSTPFLEPMISKVPVPIALERIKLESNTATDRFSTVMEHRTPLVNRILPRLDS